MSATDLLNLVDQLVYLSIFVLVGVRAVRRPTRVNVDIGLFFGAIVVLLGARQAIELTGRESDPAAGVATFLILNTLPFLMLRLVDDFADPPRWFLGAALGYLLALVALAVIIGPDLPPWVLLLSIGWFAVVGVYATSAFARRARLDWGVTRRRMTVVTAGFVMIVVAVIVSLIGGLLPPIIEVTRLIARAIGAVAGVAFFAGFVPPAWLRRVWQEPELHTFIERGTRLRTTDRAATIASLERDAARALGAAGASIGLWEPATGRIIYRTADGQPLDFGADELIGGWAFSRQQALVSLNAPRDDPEHAELYRAYNALAVIAAPITSGDRRWGVLGVFARRPSIFSDDDSRLVQLMADQIAVTLDSIDLVSEAARLRAREEAARLKEDFLSAAAHDLRTPLTVLLGQAELMERQLGRDPSAPANPDRVRAIIAEGRRLRSLIGDLLDASRVESGQLVGERMEIDLAEAAAEACARHAEGSVPCSVEALERVPANVDPVRLAQLLDNLIENGQKYGRESSGVTVRVWRDDSQARISVSDRGIGIPPGEVGQIFERFQRGSNVDDRRYSGMGLGLYICRAIVEQHGGRIWVKSELERGTTVDVAIPTAVPAAAATTRGPEQPRQCAI